MCYTWCYIPLHRYPWCPGLEPRSLLYLVPTKYIFQPCALAHVRNNISIILWQSSLRETVDFELATRWTKWSHKILRLIIARMSLLLQMWSVAFFWACNEELILGFADCLGVFVSVLFCESDEQVSQFYHQILRWHLLKKKVWLRKGEFAPMFQKKTYQSELWKWPEITSCRTKLKET